MSVLGSGSDDRRSRYITDIGHGRERIRGCCSRTRRRSALALGELDSSRAVCRRLGQGRGATTAIDGGRLPRSRGNGVVQMLSLKGRVLRSWSFGERVVTARLRGRRLAVQHGTDGGRLTTPRRERSGSLDRHADRRRAASAPAGIQGDLVVYETGGAIHLLRLSLAHDKALRLPGAAPWLDASLGPGGLFVSWNQMYAPAGSHRVHPAADDRRPLVGGGDEGGQPQGADRPGPVTRHGLHRASRSHRAPRFRPWIGLSREQARGIEKEHTGLEESWPGFSRQDPAALVFGLAARGDCDRRGAGAEADRALRRIDRRRRRRHWRAIAERSRSRSRPGARRSGRAPR